MKERYSEPIPIGYENIPPVLGEAPRIEQEIWHNKLGARVETKPLPEYVTRKVIEKLGEQGFESIIYMPRLKLRDLAYLKLVGVDKYIEELTRDYPKLRPLESLFHLQKTNVNISRMPEKWFFQNVMDEKIDFPSLPGQWMAIETVDKPKRGEKYKDTPLADRIGLPGDRFNKLWITVDNAIKNEKTKFLREVDLLHTPADLRQFEVFEWSLIANRFGWGATNSYEWTNTEYRGSGSSNHCIVGSSDNGGAGNVFWDYPGYAKSYVGWRSAVVLGYFNR